MLCYFATAVLTQSPLPLLPLRYSAHMYSRYHRALTIRIALSVDGGGMFAYNDVTITSITRVSITSCTAGCTIYIHRCHAGSALCKI